MSNCEIVPDEVLMHLMQLHNHCVRLFVAFSEAMTEHTPLLNVHTAALRYAEYITSLSDLIEHQLAHRDEPDDDMVADMFAMLNKLLEEDPSNGS